LGPGDAASRCSRRGACRAARPSGTVEGRQQRGRNRRTGATCAPAVDFSRYSAPSSGRLRRRWLRVFLASAAWHWTTMDGRARWTVYPIWELLGARRPAAARTVPSVRAIMKLGARKVRRRGLRICRSVMRPPNFKAGACRPGAWARPYDVIVSSYIFACLHFLLGVPHCPVPFFFEPRPFVQLHTWAAFPTPSSSPQRFHSSQVRLPPLLCSAENGNEAAPAVCLAASGDAAGGRGRADRAWARRARRLFWGGGDHASRAVIGRVLALALPNQIVHTAPTSSMAARATLKRRPASSIMSTSPYVIVTATLYMLAGSSSLAPRHMCPCMHSTPVSTPSTRCEYPLSTRVRTR
jgi:hypothetical protein